MPGRPAKYDTTAAAAAAATAATTEEVRGVVFGVRRDAPRGREFDSVKSPTPDKLKSTDKLKPKNCF